MANLVSYAKQKWEDAKTAITAARLNNMEDGISNCAAQINALGDSVSRNEIVHGSTIADVGIDADGKTLLIDYTSNGVRYRAVFIANER